MAAEARKSPVLITEHGAFITRDQRGRLRIVAAESSEVASQIEAILRDQRCRENTSMTGDAMDIASG